MIIFFYRFFVSKQLACVSTKMHSNLLSNLSYSMNLPKTTVHSEDVVTAVNKTLTVYYHEAHYQDYANFYKFHKNLFGAELQSATMQSEKMILCEINACLWIKALNSAISSITKQIYPHYIIVEQFINYIFNAKSDENFGLVQEFFWKLLVTHPPKLEMLDYYRLILTEYFVKLNEIKTEDQNLFFCLLEIMTCGLKYNINSNGKDGSDMLETRYEFPRGKRETSEKISSNVRPLKVVEKFNIESNELPEAKLNKKHFVEFPWNERIKRCLIGLNFVYDILETDFNFWLSSEKLQPSFSDRRPLISYLLWQNTRDIGLINKEVHKILALFELFLQSGALGFQNMRVIEKLVILIGEVIRCSDSVEEMKYPFAGRKCENFFRELSIILHQQIVHFKKIPSENELIVNLKPPWLRLFSCCHLLSSLTGHTCSSDLTGVYDILEHIAHNENKSQNMTEGLVERKSTTNSKLMRKLKRLKSINGKLRNGKTHLHLACEENDIEKIKALLTFPELDVNATDRDGWTALHTAAFRDNTASIQELLSFSPHSGDAQKSVNTRARGPESVTPLMCAVSEGHAKVCQLLLEHSGSVLLEDVNELNLTPLELSNKQEVTEILKYYKENNVWTLHSHSTIKFDSDLKEVVLRLCIEMIQAYFCTYRTWDIYKTLKRSDKNLKENPIVPDVDCKWDYMRYHRDIKRNIYKLRRLLPKLDNIKEFKPLSDIYVRLLSFNKIC